MKKLKFKFDTNATGLYADGRHYYSIHSSELGFKLYFGEFSIYFALLEDAIAMANLHYNFPDDQKEPK